MKLRRLLAMAALVCWVTGAQAQPISQLPAATSGNSTDLIPCVQGSGPRVTRKCTAAQIVQGGGVGSLGLQNANAATITGGSVNGTTIGGTTPAPGTFTTLSATGLIAQSTASYATGGTSCTNATLLTAQQNTITDTTAGQYFKLAAATGAKISVYVTGGATENICPNTSSGQIGNAGVGAAVGVPNAAGFISSGSDIWTVSAP